MTKKRRGFLSVDPGGHLSAPPEVAGRLIMAEGEKLYFQQDASGALKFAPAATSLARVYVEPTNQCNLFCATCMRNAWDEAPGQMDWQTYGRVLDGIKSFSPPPMVFFGGFGEPLSHPHIQEMIRQASDLGAETELITNGTLLTSGMARGLVESGLQRLWVSIDGASPEAYLDVRLGDALPVVLENLEGLSQARRTAGSETPRLGIAFVAMKRNIAELPKVIQLGQKLVADRFSISNLLPHSPDMLEEILYRGSFFEEAGPPSPQAPLVELPRMEINDLTRQPLVEVLEGKRQLRLAGQDLSLGGRTCPFAMKGSLSVRWDGQVSPCLPLLHGHTSYLSGTRRVVEPFFFASLKETSLRSIWESSPAAELRERLLLFDFSPCVSCNSCEMAESNQEDCFGNVLPACGGCLWAQGFIQCP